MVGGKDEVYIKQHSSSQLSELEFRNYVREIGNERFSGAESKSNEPPINYSEKVSQFLVFHLVLIVQYYSLFSCIEGV
jgi:hypothetical protein